MSSLRLHVGRFLASFTKVQPLCHPAHGSLLISPVNISLQSSRLIQTSIAANARLTTFTRKDRPSENHFREPKDWPLKNAVMYPPQDPNDPVRRAEYFHHRSNVKYSPKKLWYICCLVRGMTVDEAIKQLQFIHKKGAILMREVLEEAREIALKEHNFELKSNMFIGQAHAIKGLVIKGFRKHARYKMGVIHYVHSHIMVQLVEGPPPDYYYQNTIRTNREKLDKYIDDLRRREVKFSL